MENNNITVLKMFRARDYPNLHVLNLYWYNLTGRITL